LAGWIISATFAYQTVGFMKDSKEHILLNSFHLFLQKGFKEVTMKEIVNRTGLSKGAFYHYFNSKEQVFEEVIAHFFAAAISFDHDTLPQTSLKKFYRGVIDNYNKETSAASKLIPVDKQNSFNHNFYYLIFDAMRILPDFKKNHLAQQKAEFKIWKSVIALARKNKEIKTVMTDDQLARLFISSSDGTNISLIMSDKAGKMGEELKWLWDGLYGSIKTK
jgi:TetR/AcrR family transcriptional repressor of nem operon